VFPSGITLIGEFFQKDAEGGKENSVGHGQNQKEDKELQGEETE
jgi:hypothetical protein